MVLGLWKHDYATLMMLVVEVELSLSFEKWFLQPKSSLMSGSPLQQGAEFSPNASALIKTSLNERFETIHTLSILPNLYLYFFTKFTKFIPKLNIVPKQVMNLLVFRIKLCSRTVYNT